MKRIYFILLIIGVALFFIGCKENKGDNGGLEPVNIDINNVNESNAEISDDVKQLLISYLRDQKNVKGDIENEIDIKEIKVDLFNKEQNLQLYEVVLDYAWIHSIAVLKDNEVMGILSGMSDNELFLADLDNDNSYEIIYSTEIGSGMLRNVIEVMRIQDGEIYNITLYEDNKRIALLPNKSDQRLYIHWNYFDLDRIAEEPIGYLKLKDDKLVIEQSNYSNTKEVIQDKAIVKENIEINEGVGKSETNKTDIDENNSQSSKKDEKKDSIVELKPKLIDVTDYCGDGILEEFKGGCSWYCGGQSQSIHPSASSELKPQDKKTYGAKNVHDFDLFTVWAEGVDGYGIGEYLEYHIDPLGDLAITEIEIINGYIKSEDLWKANSRVKKIKVWKDDKPFAILLLEDAQQVQVFNIGNISLGKGTKLKFEILEVYKGSQYDDVVITEIEFNGTGVH